MIFNSTIISKNSCHRTELASFLAPAVGQIESKWKLCYNALANGWEPRIFHSNCDNKKHTSPSAGTWGETLKAFVFSLKNSEDLPPFKCFAKNQYRTVYKSSSYGPKFGKLEIAYRYSNKRVEARAFLYKPYGVPAEVKNSYNDLVGTAKPFSPDNYEVFFLTGKSILDKNKQRIKEKMSNDMHFAGLRPKQCLRSRGSQWFLYCCLLIT
ncbi:hypothetical protein P5673_020326 [Acropora cervicornis]|uniref:Uncharacterized protein n=1 Tax=Acropora cervicornis TaxID=6130 RepID=A0AAD9V1F3_ACRCE|nr:hypothetical protein P5673_020326 [Acropora cervicornis]